MKLLTKQLEKRFAQIGSQVEIEDPVVVAKFFNPSGAGTWYMTSYDPETRQFFGYASNCCEWNDEWGFFSLDELAICRGRFGQSIERDRSFVEQPFSQIEIF